MDTPTGGGRDSRFNMGYNMSLLSGDAQTDIYGNTGHSRPSTSLPSGVPRPSMTLPGSCGAAGIQRGLKRTSSDVCFDQEVSGTRPTMLAQSGMGMTGADCTDIGDDGFSQTQKKTPPPNGKKTKGRVKIKMEYIDNKLRRYTTFSKRKTGIMKKAYELSTLTGTQVMLLVASETGHVYTFATRKLQPMITSEAGKALIQTCLNSPDPTPSGGIGDQRMSATGFEETELTYNIGDEEQKEAGGMSPRSDGGGDTGDSSGNESPGMPDEIGNHLRGNMSNDSNDSSSPPPELKYSPGGLSQSHLLSAGSYPGGLMYQSPQGMVFHGPATGLPNGLVFSVAPHAQAQAHTLHLQQDKGVVGSQSSRSQQQQFITIPFPIAMPASNGHHADTQAADLTKTRK